MAILVTRQPVTLETDARTFRSTPVVADPMTHAIRVRLARPTALSAETTTVQVALVLTVDGREYRATGRMSNGVQYHVDGSEALVYELTYHPTVFLGTKGRAAMARATPDAQGFYADIPLTRLTEDAQQITAHVELTLLRGRAFMELLLAESIEAPPPTIRTKNSVAFDAATDAQEIGGDAVISLPHTAGGSDRAIFAGVGNSDSSPQAASSITYGGVGMTEMWDIGPGAAFSRNAGYQLAGDGNVATGAQTVTATLAGSASEKMLAVVSMTGVDSTTPVGTPATEVSTDTTPSATSPDAATDDLVVDFVYTASNSGMTEAGSTPDAGQTSQTEEVYEGGSFSVFAGTSTRAGADGGVMSWAITNGGFYGMTIGCVAFKPAAVVGAPLMSQNIERRIAHPVAIRPRPFAPGVQR